MSKLVRQGASTPISSTTSSSTQLLRRLTSSPALPALVQGLQPHGLKALIEEVGVADAGEIMQLATPSQLRAALDMAVWASPERGAAEVFAPDQFINWLETWLGVGEAFTAERLCALGEEYLAYAFNGLIKVRDTQAEDAQPRPDTDVDDDEFAQEQEADDALYAAMALQFGEFVVVAAVADEWDVVSAALHALWGDAPDALIDMLRRLTPVHSHWRHADELVARLQTDVTAAREQLQEGAGFVTPAGARAFLAGLSQLGPAGLEAATAYDGETASYFARLDAVRTAEAAEAARAGSGVSGAAEDASEPPHAAADAGELAELQVLLATAGIGSSQFGAATAGLLASPSADGGRPQLRAALEKLQLTSPHAVADRLRELSYLANIVVQSLRRNGAALVAHEASEAVVATASLGLAWLHVRDPSAAARALHSEPGAVRLFGIGWCLIGGLPARVVSACELAFAGEAVTARLARRNWMRDEVERALDDLRRCVREQAFVDAREALTLLSLVFDPSTCRALRPVLDEVPRISMRGHVPTVSPADASDERARWISGLDDLRSIAELLQRL